MRDIRGEIALVTGASRGIGRAIAVSLAQAGCHLALMARSADSLAETAALCEQYGSETLILPLDLTDRQALQQGIEAVVQKFGALHILINNAGIYQPGPIQEHPIEVWEQTIQLNLLSAMSATRFALPHIQQQPYGAILFVSSLAGKMGLKHASPYCASKHGIQGFAESLFAELREQNIKISTICPGYVNTEMQPGDHFARNDMIQPNDVATTILFVLQFPTNACPTEIVLHPQRNPIAQPTTQLHTIPTTSNAELEAVLDSQAINEALDSLDSLDAFTTSIEIHDTTQQADTPEEFTFQEDALNLEQAFDAATPPTTTDTTNDIKPTPETTDAKEEIKETADTQPEESVEPNETDETEKPVETTDDTDTTADATKEPTTTDNQDAESINTEPTTETTDPGTTEEETTTEDTVEANNTEPAEEEIAAENPPEEDTVESTDTSTAAAEHTTAEAEENSENTNESTESIEAEAATPPTQTTEETTATTEDESNDAPKANDEAIATQSTEVSNEVEYTQPPAAESTPPDTSPTTDTNTPAETIESEGIISVRGEDAAVETETTVAHTDNTPPIATNESTTQEEKTHEPQQEKALKQENPLESLEIEVDLGFDTKKIETTNINDTKQNTITKKSGREGDSKTSPSNIQPESSSLSLTSTSTVMPESDDSTQVYGEPVKIQPTSVVVNATAGETNDTMRIDKETLSPAIQEAIKHPQGQPPERTNETSTTKKSEEKVTVPPAPVTNNPPFPTLSPNTTNNSPAQLNNLLDSLPGGLPSLPEPGDVFAPLPPLTGPGSSEQLPTAGLPPLPPQGELPPMTPTIQQPGPPSQTGLQQPAAITPSQPTLPIATADPQPSTNPPQNVATVDTPSSHDETKTPLSQNKTLQETMAPTEAIEDDSDSTLHIQRPPAAQRSLVRDLPPFPEDADIVFEDMVQSLEVEEFQVMEVLGTAKRMFWEPLKNTAQQTAFENIVAFLHSLDLSPIRRALMEMGKTISQDIGNVYSNHLDELTRNGDLTADEQALYHLSAVQKEHIQGDIRSPFREFIERLEQLDQAQEQILNLLHEHISTQLGRLPPLLDAGLLDKLDQVEEAQGIEASWRVLLAAMQAGLAYYQNEAANEVAQLTDAMEQFISQFEPTYTALLNRVIEVWSDRLMPPLQAITQ